jgi:indole-3-glycerol phosphate synthase
LGISESGIRTKEDVKFVTDQGIHCLLVGESLMKNPDPAAALANLKG